MSVEAMLRVCKRSPDNREDGRRGEKSRTRNEMVIARVRACEGARVQVCARCARRGREGFSAPHPSLLPSLFVFLPHKGRPRIFYFIISFKYIHECRLFSNSLFLFIPLKILIVLFVLSFISLHASSA